MDRGAGANRSRAPKLAFRTGQQKFARIVTKVIRHSNSSIEALRVRLVQPHAWTAREAGPQTRLQFRDNPGDWIAKRCGGDRHAVDGPKHTGAALSVESNRRWRSHDVRNYGLVKRSYVSSKRPAADCGIFLPSVRMVLAAYAGPTPTYTGKAAETFVTREKEIYMGARCFLERRWFIDAVVAAVGVDWDGWFRRVAPAEFEGMGDWAAISKQIRRYDEITFSFAEFAELRETRRKNALAAGI